MDDHDAHDYAPTTDGDHVWNTCRVCGEVDPATPAPAPAPEVIGEGDVVAVTLTDQP